MTTARNAACWLCKLYRERKSEGISEMVLHKLLYLSQRESLIVNPDSPLFPDSFEAWRFGPVMCEIRSDFSRIVNADESEFGPLEGTDEQSIRSVIERYADKGAWSLVSLTHGESSWSNARQGYASDDRCRKPITVAAIQIDAARIRERRRLIEDRRRLRGNI